MLAKHRDDLFAFAFAHQPVINIDTGQLRADRLVDQDGRDRAVNAARQRADDTFVADLRADLRDGLFAVGAHCPVAGKPGKPHEVLIEFRALWGVVHLGVELHRIEIARRIGGDGKGRIG